MIIGLCFDFCICLCWVSTLSLDFLFLSGFSESVVVVYYLFSQPVQLVCSQGLPPGIGTWDTLMSWRNNFGKVIHPSLGMKSERKGKPQQFSNYRAGFETEGT